MFDRFVDSPIVQKCIEEIQDLQEAVETYEFFTEMCGFDVDRQEEHLQILMVLMEKQKNLYLRCMLSDSPSAKQLLNDVHEHFKNFGYDPDRTPIWDIFDEVEQNIKNNLEHLGGPETGTSSLG